MENIIMKHIPIEYLERQILGDITLCKSGNKVRYESLISDLSKVNCIDEPLFKQHNDYFTKHGFYEYKRTAVKIDGHDFTLVVMRNTDDNIVVDSCISLITGYLKADCELTYYEYIKK